MPDDWPEMQTYIDSMFDREYLFEILIESLFPDRQTDTYVVTVDNRNCSNQMSEAVEWDILVTELEQQAVLGIASLVLEKKSQEGMPGNVLNRITMKKRQIIMRYTQMAVVQDKICRCLMEHNITVAVMKGMAAACYYPYPSLRTMGDIDLIVMPEQYHQAVRFLLKAGLKKTSESDAYHTTMSIEGFLVELHRSPASVHKDIHGDFIRNFILSGLNDVEMAVADKYSFPMLPWQQNGMELIWHIRQHLYNGLGLRQVIDWMMFAEHYLDDLNYYEFEPALKKSGLLNLAAAVTKMCQKYLGLREEGISWCREADEQLCDDLMDYIMEQGNFGNKRQDDKAAKVMTGYSDFGMLFREMQRRGENTWETAKVHPALRPFSWIYALKESAKSGLRLSDLIKGIKVGKKRKKMFGRLYTMGSRKNLRTVVEIINSGRWNILFSWLYMAASAVEYKLLQVVWSYGLHENVSPQQKNEVERDVTIIFKSFERQRMVKQLVGSIRKQYPDIKIVIADDSEKPLLIEDPNIDIIQLPFNSGLSRGLNAALERVTTPYVMRMDDDELLTCRTKLVRQMEFLKDHEEVGLVAFGVRDGLRPDSLKHRYKSYAGQSLDYAPKPLLIPHGTRIDNNHIVFAKVPNVFIARTALIKKVGYDNRVRMLDHNDFFYRASGIIASVLAEDTIIYHRHNLFDKEYMYYRSNTEGDLRIINQPREIEKNFDTD